MAALPANGTIRTLTAREMPLLREHLLRLDSASRRDRFNGAADERFIESYAARCLADGTVVIAYVEDDKVLGAAELHQPDSSDGGMPEIAFSVERSVRRKGVGTILFRRLIAEAEGRGYRSLRITTGYSNGAMRALANKFGAHLTFRQGESTGSIDLKQQKQPELGKPSSAVSKAVRASVSFNRAWWKLLWGMSGWGRAAQPRAE
ncbi:GNAT family N-acetyltransferase [uncultured Bradyrhizobium sp.]|uniref:GNAT family N-acetyltransferase n=1 Tax=uncultured Bradyrhizobium sp. TaxID=199684 RepID=UPI0035CAD22D